MRSVAEKKKLYANGNCASRSYSEIAEGARVGLEVCLTTNGGANLHFCSSTTATA